MRKTIMRLVSRALTVTLTMGVLGMTTLSSAQVRQRVVIIQRVPVIDPFFGYPFAYAYPPGYVGTYYGYVKIKTHGHEPSRPKLLLRTDGSGPIGQRGVQGQ